MGSNVNKAWNVWTRHWKQLQNIETAWNKGSTAGNSGLIVKYELKETLKLNKEKKKQINAR